MTKKKTEKAQAPLVHLSLYCPQCLAGLPMRMPTALEALTPQMVTCSQCGWTGEIQPFVPATSVVD